MEINVLEKPSGYRRNTRSLLKVMVNKLCGVVVDLGYLSPNSTDPRVLTSGAYLTGIHTLLNRDDPGRGGYHVGGIGVLPNETMIKSLAESIERYCQLIAMRDMEKKIPTRFSSFEQLQKEGEVVITESSLQFFSESQMRKPNFVFDSYHPSKPIQWVQVKSLISGRPIWCPAQLLFVGYNTQHDKREPLLNTAVTTGTAVHVSRPLALRGAILEKIQLDSAMGHWYSNSTCHEILLDTRTAALKRLLNKYFSTSSVLKYQFYWLPNPDLSAFSIACVISKNKRSVPPVISVGLGIDTNLERAMYKSLLEAYSIVGLSRMVLFKEKYIDGCSDHVPDTSAMLDLNKNIAYYSKGMGSEIVSDRFFNAPSILASQIPADMKGSIEQQNIALLQSFKDSDKEIICVDLTTVEAENLGLFAVRVWSPDTLSLCLPSLPPCAHARFDSYGGVAHQHPHPYP